ncbi:MAG: cupin domain-containing protein [Steroidobacteraceae bacterium]
MKKINLAAIAADALSGYPPPFDAPCNGQTCQRLGRSQGLTLFGVNLTVIPAGGWSSQRHWHSHEDEFVWIVEGELTLVTGDGEETLRPGDCAAFKAGDPDGHHLVNRSDRPAKVLEIGNSDSRDRCVYPDIDMIAGPGTAGVQPSRRFALPDKSALGPRACRHRYGA